MGNPRIEKASADIARTKAKIAEYTAKATELTAKLRELEKQKINIENEEIIALFRREKLNEDEFAALLRMQKKDGNTDAADIPANEPRDDEPAQETEMEGNSGHEE